MAEPYKPKIFLSSTFLDLSETRAEIIRWLSGIFRTDLIVMETFGSDVDPPNINSVRRVRECDLFIGIYAHRYGTIDQQSGESITELELDESKRAFSSGVLRDILLYEIDNSANWLVEYKETSQEGQAGLTRLKEKARHHTSTTFKNRDDLLFSIIRDVFRKVSGHLIAQPPRVRPFRLPSERNLQQPMGMEFLTSEYKCYLAGRQQTVTKLISRLGDDPIILLLGDSGVGKTSLIHAGLIPEATKIEFRSVYTRPLGLPCTDVVRQIEMSVFEGQITSRRSLVPLLAEVAGVLGDEKVLLIIDQFEDVLTARDSRETELLVSELRSIKELAIPSLRILISYRADLEGRLGEYWQKISGSPQGLPRMYLGGIVEDEAWNGVKRVAQDLSVDIHLNDAEQKRLKNDLLVASKPSGVTGVYPPYIQMLIDHIWSSSKREKGKYHIKNYREAGGMEGVIGGYLSRQLEYARDNEGHIRIVLISLVRSYGVKAQRSMEEILADTSLNRRHCEIALEKLIDLRLVRHIDTYYEVSHDFIAHKIIAELVDSEEREFKRFRELLNSKAAAYQTTQNPLTSEELLMLYKHRTRVVPNDEEVHLLLSTWLQDVGPALYWLLKSDNAKMLEWLRAEESKEGLTREQNVSAILLRRKLGETGLLAEDYSVFRGYQLSNEMSSLILEDALLMSKKLLMYGLRHQRNEVRKAAGYAVALQVKNGDLEWLEQLRKSSSRRCQQALRELILSDDVLLIDKKGAENKAVQEFRLLREIGHASNPFEARQLLEKLIKTRPLKRSLIFGRSLAYIREGRIKKLIREAERFSAEVAEVLLAGIGRQITTEDFNLIVTEYEKWNSKEQGRYRRRAIYIKAASYADAILRSASQKNLQRLREAIKKIRFTPSARSIVFAVLRYGDLYDIKLVLDRIAGEKERIDFWNHTELGRTIARRMEEIGGGIPEFLQEIFRKKEFWEYILPEERRKVAARDLLPLKDRDNRPLYIRLAAHAMIGIAKMDDQEYLLKLTTHDYGLIARTASIRLVRLLKKESLNLITARVDDSIRVGKTKSLAEALRTVELELYGVANLW